MQDENVNQIRQDISPDRKGSNKKKIILAVVLLVIAGLVLAWTVPAGYRYYMSKRPIPTWASQSALEERYAEQIGLLRKLAADPEKGQENCLTNFSSEIFKMQGFPEILVAELILPNEPGLVFFDKRIAKEATCYAEPGPEGKIDVVTIWYCKAYEGESYKVVQYQGEVTDTRGRKVGYVLKIDMEQLERLSGTQ